MSHSCALEYTYFYFLCMYHSQVNRKYQKCNCNKWRDRNKVIKCNHKKCLSITGLDYREGWANRKYNTMYSILIAHLKGLCDSIHFSRALLKSNFAEPDNKINKLIVITGCSCCNLLIFTVVQLIDIVNKITKITPWHGKNKNKK
jgi:hypothetical protein